MFAASLFQAHNFWDFAQHVVYANQMRELYTSAATVIWSALIASETVCGKTARCVAQRVLLGRAKDYWSTDSSLPARKGRTHSATE